METKKNAKKDFKRPSTKTTRPDAVNLKERKALDIIAQATTQKKQVTRGFVFKDEGDSNSGDEEFAKSSNIATTAIEKDEDIKSVKSSIPDSAEIDDNEEATEQGYIPGEVTVVQYCEQCGSKARFVAKWSSFRFFCGSNCEAAFKKRAEFKVSTPGMDPIPYAKGIFEKAPDKRQPHVELDEKGSSTAINQKSKKTKF
jgi:hypothetical protein